MELEALVLLYARAVPGAESMTTRQTLFHLAASTLLNTHARHQQEEEERQSRDGRGGRESEEGEVGLKSSAADASALTHLASSAALSSSSSTAAAAMSLQRVTGWCSVRYSCAMCVP